MWRRVYRQRRRLAIGLGLFALIAASSVPRALLDELALELLGLALALTALFGALIAVRPRWGLAVELLAATMLLQQLLFALSPMLEWKMRDSSALLMLAFWLFIYYTLFSLGGALDALTWPGGLSLRARRLVARPPGRVWEALALEPGRAHWNPDIAVVAPARGGDGVELVPADPDGPITPGTTERLLEAEPLRYRHSLRLYGTLEPDRPGPTTDERIRLSERPGGTLVELERVHRRLPLGTAIRLWLEDQAGDALDDFAATLEGGANWSLSALRRQRRLRRLAAASA